MNTFQETGLNLRKEENQWFYGRDPLTFIFRKSEQPKQNYLLQSKKNNIRLIDCHFHESP